VAVLQGISERAPFLRVEPPQDFSPDLVEAIFAAEAGDVVVGRNAEDDAVLIVHLRGIVPIDDEALVERAEERDDLMAASMMRDQLEYFVRALEERHGAAVNMSAVNGVLEHIGQSGY